MNMFFDLPDRVEIGGKTVPIDTDFRNGVRLSIAARDENITQDELLRCGLSLFFGQELQVYIHLKEAVAYLTYFFSAGKVEGAEHVMENIKNQSVSYDFESDEALIAAAFQKEYGIDLYTCQMHWWRFLQLLDPLVSGVDFTEVVRCRNAKNVPKDLRKHVNTVKISYPLPARKMKQRNSPIKTQDDFKAQMLEKARRRQQEVQKKMSDEQRNISEKPPE